MRFWRHIGTKVKGSGPSGMGCGTGGDMYETLSLTALKTKAPKILSISNRVLVNAHFTLCQICVWEPIL